MSDITVYSDWQKSAFGIKRTNSKFFQTICIDFKFDEKPFYKIYLYGGLNKSSISELHNKTFSSLEEAKNVVDKYIKLVVFI